MKGTDGAAGEILLKPTARFEPIEIGRCRMALSMHPSRCVPANIFWGNRNRPARSKLAAARRPDRSAKQALGMSEMKEFKATVKEVTPLVDADMGKALGELRYVSVTFSIEGAQEDLGPVVRAEFKEPEKFSGSNELERADNAPVEGYLVRNGIFKVSLLENHQLVVGASFPVKIATVSDSKD